MKNKKLTSYNVMIRATINCTSTTIALNWKRKCLSAIINSNPKKHTEKKNIYILNTNYINDIDSFWRVQIY